MQLKFNEAQLSRPQRESLVMSVLALQGNNEIELVVTPFEFPEKLLVIGDDGIGVIIAWDGEQYSCLEKPLEPESPNKPEAGSIKPFELPESQKETVDLPKPESEPKPIQELVKSEIGQRAEALAQALVNLSKPLDSYQRGEFWFQFCTIYFKELME